MTEMLKRSNLKKNKKGFTLVEIIVVLVIIAILAAIAIPTMLGFVNEARQSEYIAEGRTAYVAAQTIATREIALDKTVAEAQTAITIDAVKAITGSATKVVKLGAITVNGISGKVETFECYVSKTSSTTGAGYKVTINTLNNTATCEKVDSIPA